MNLFRRKHVIFCALTRTGLSSLLKKKNLLSMTPWLNEHALETSHTEMPFVKSGDHFESMK